MFISQHTPPTIETLGSPPVPQALKPMQDPPLDPVVHPCLTAQQYVLIQHELEEPPYKAHTLNYSGHICHNYSMLE